MAPIQFMARPGSTQRTAGADAPSCITFFKPIGAQSHGLNSSFSSAAAERAEVVAGIAALQAGGPLVQHHTELMPHAQQLAQRSAPQPAQRISLPPIQALQEQAAADGRAVCLEAGLVRPGNKQMEVPKALAPAPSGIHFLGSDTANDLLQWLPPTAAAQQSRSTERNAWPIPTSLLPVLTGSELPSASGRLAAPSTEFYSLSSGFASPVSSAVVAYSTSGGQSTTLHAEGQLDRGLPAPDEAHVSLQHVESFEFNILQGSGEGSNSALLASAWSPVSEVCVLLPTYQPAHGDASHSGVPAAGSSPEPTGRWPPSSSASLTFPTALKSTPRSLAQRLLISDAAAPRKVGSSVGGEHVDMADDMSKQAVESPAVWLHRAPGLGPPHAPATRNAASDFPAAAIPAAVNGVSKFRAYQRQLGQQAPTLDSAPARRGAPAGPLHLQPSVHSPSLDSWLDVTSLAAATFCNFPPRDAALSRPMTAEKYIPSGAFPTGTEAPEGAVAQLPATDQQVRAQQSQRPLNAARLQEASVSVHNEELTSVRGEEDHVGGECASEAGKPLQELPTAQIPAAGTNLLTQDTIQDTVSSNLLAQSVQQHISKSPLGAEEGEALHAELLVACKLAQQKAVISSDAHLEAERLQQKLATAKGSSVEQTPVIRRLEAPSLCSAAALTVEREQQHASELAALREALATAMRDSAAIIECLSSSKRQLGSELASVQATLGAASAKSAEELQEAGQAAANERQAAATAAAAVQSAQMDESAAAAGEGTRIASEMAVLREQMQLAAGEAAQQSNRAALAELACLRLEADLAPARQQLEDSATERGVLARQLEVTREQFQQSSTAAAQQQQWNDSRCEDMAATLQQQSAEMAALREVVRDRATECEDHAAELERLHGQLQCAQASALEQQAMLEAALIERREATDQMLAFHQLREEAVQEAASTGERLASELAAGCAEVAALQEAATASGAQQSAALQVLQEAFQRQGAELERMRESAAGQQSEQSEVAPQHSLADDFGNSAQRLAPEMVTALEDQVSSLKAAHAQECSAASAAEAAVVEVCRQKLEAVQRIQALEIQLAALQRSAEAAALQTAEMQAHFSGLQLELEASLSTAAERVEQLQLQSQEHEQRAELGVKECVRLREQHVVLVEQLREAEAEAHASAAQEKLRREEQARARAAVLELDAMQLRQQLEDSPGLTSTAPAEELVRPWEALELLEGEVAGSRAEAAALQERVSALEADLEAARAEGPPAAVAEAASERAALRHRAGELDEQLADLRAELDAVKEAYVGSRSDLEDLEAAHQCLQRDAGRLSQRLAAKLDTAAIREVRAEEAEKSRLRLERAQAAIEQQRNSCTALERRLTEAQAAAAAAVPAEVAPEAMGFPEPPHPAVVSEAGPLTPLPNNEAQVGALQAALSVERTRNRTLKAQLSLLIAAGHADLAQRSAGTTDAEQPLPMHVATLEARAQAAEAAVVRERARGEAASATVQKLLASNKDLIDRLARAIPYEGASSNTAPATKATMCQLPGGMEVTDEQLQLLALAEEVERLQVVVSDERAARDALRRHFLKLSAPASNAALQMRAAQEFRTLDASPLFTSNGSSGAELAGSQVVSLSGKTVVEQVQQAVHLGSVHSTAITVLPRAKRSRRPFSLWNFVTGADKLIEQDESAD